MVSNIISSANANIATLAKITDKDNTCGKKVSENPKHNMPAIPQHTKKTAAPIQKPYTKIVKKSCKKANIPKTKMDFKIEKMVDVLF